MNYNPSTFNHQIARHLRYVLNARYPTKKFIVESADETDEGGWSFGVRVLVKIKRKFCRGYRLICFTGLNQHGEPHWIKKTSHFSKFVNDELKKYLPAKKKKKKKAIKKPKTENPDFNIGGAL